MKVAAARWCYFFSQVPGEMHYVPSTTRRITGGASNPCWGRKTQGSLVVKIVRFFTWWHGQTLNTALHTLLFGKFVGKDEYGNRYYRTRKIDKALGFERRWVIYAGESDGSMTPQGWYGWLHHTFDVPPTQEEYAPRTWELPHQPNLTGTPQAWRPPGSTLAANARPPATGDYEAWTPEG